MGTVHGICPFDSVLVMRKFDGGAFWVGCGWFFFGTLVGGTGAGKRQHKGTYISLVVTSGLTSA